MSTSTHEQINAISFEQLIAIQFFGKELTFWLNAKDAAKLKQCSKILNQFIKMENVLIENEPLMFRKLVFQKKFNLLEKCIPFRINKQQSYPSSIETKLFQGFARIGNLKAIKNLYLQQSIRSKTYPALIVAVESGHIEIVHFLFEHWSRDGKQILSEAHLILQKLLHFNHMEIALLLLLSSPEPQWKKFRELISKQQQSTNSIDPHYLEYLVWLPTAPVPYYTHLSTFLTNFEKPIVPNELEMRIREFPFLIPQRIINELEVTFKTLSKFEENKSSINQYKARWSVFVDDFQTFQSLAINFEFLFQVTTQKSATKTLFEFVVERTIQRNLNPEFFNLCLKLFEEKAKLKSKPGKDYLSVYVSKSIENAVTFFTKFHRFDMFSRLISIPTPHLQVDFLTLVQVEDIRFLKKFIEKRKFSFSKTNGHLIQPAFDFAVEDGHYEVLEILLQLISDVQRESLDLFSMWESMLICGDIDFMKYVMKKFNFLSCWQSILQSALVWADEDIVRFILEFVRKNVRNEKALRHLLFGIRSTISNQNILSMLLCCCEMSSSKSSLLSFEALISLQFFGKELIFWLNAKDVVNLKRCSKILNQWIKMDDIIFENEPFLFRRLIFQKKFEMLAKCIPFRTNKQQTFPIGISNEIFRGFARIGNLKAIQRTISLQPNILSQLSSCLFAAVEAGQIEIVRFLIEFQQLGSTNKTTTFEFTSSIELLLQRAYVLNQKEIMMILISHFSKMEEKWKTLFDLISNAQSKNDEVFVDYLFSLSCVDALGAVEDFKKTGSNLLPTYLKNVENTNLIDQLSNFSIGDDFPFLIPPKTMNQFELTSSTQIQSYLNRAKLLWSVFIDDFDRFKSLSTNSSQQQLTLFEIFPQKHEISSVFAFVIFRTGQRNLRLEFFNHCMYAFKELVKADKIDMDLIICIDRVITVAIRMHRVDLLKELFSDQTLNPEIWGYGGDSLVKLACEVGSIDVAKKMVEIDVSFQTYWDSSRPTILLTGALNFQNNTEIVEFLTELVDESLKKRQTVVFRNWIPFWQELLHYGDIDLLKRIQKMPADPNFLETFKFWNHFLLYAISLRDVLVIEFLLNLMENEQHSLKPIEELKRTLKSEEEKLQKEKQTQIISVLNERIQKWSS